MRSGMCSISRDSNGLRRLLLISSTFILFVVALSFLSSSSSFLSPGSRFPGASVLFSSSAVEVTAPAPPSLAYFISGTDGDSDRLFRLLLAVYHPKNVYLLHLELAASDEQRRSLALAVRSVPVFRSVGNVHVMGKADRADPRGSSALSAVLHGAAILLRLGDKWDWFVNIQASDYPLVTQDDILHIFSFIPKDLNFVQHSGHIGWKETRRIKPIIIDPGLYHSSKRAVVYATQKRNLPNAYRLFSGSSSVVLSRSFVDFCILGVDNLPRTLLMYYANIPSSHANYFHTLLCNSEPFNGSVVNHNLRYANEEKSTQMLTLDDVSSLVDRGVAFAGGFEVNSPALDWIDRELLTRQQGRVLPGGWCLGEGNADPCSVWGSAEVLKPGHGANRLENLVADLMDGDSFYSNQCISE